MSTHYTFREKLLAFSSILITSVVTLYPRAAAAAVDPAGDSAPASQAQASDLSERMGHRLGLALAYGEPAPSILGINVAYNLTDYLRAQIGGGQVSFGFGDASGSATTLGAGLKGFVPGWSLTPSLGLHMAGVIYSGDLLIRMAGFESSGVHVYGTAGLDYQAKSGFHGSLGYNLSFRPGVGGGPYVQLGWFFDLFGKNS